MSKTQKLLDALKSATTYEQRALLNVEEFGIVEKKQKFKYISWTYADMILRTLDKDSAWEPFMTEFPNLIGIKIVFEGREHKAFFPILDHANQGAVMSQDEGLVFWQTKTKSAQEGRKARVTSMDLNNSIMRGFAKEVSKLTGVGIGIYAGEDITQYDNKAVLGANSDKVEQAIALLGTNKDQVVAKLKELISKRGEIAQGDGAEAYIRNLRDSEIDEVLRIGQNG